MTDEPAGDDYCYPGTDILRNRFDIRDKDQLEQVERLICTQQLLQPYPPIEISYAGYKLVHHHLFHRLYDWAGEIRTVQIGKERWFASVNAIDGEMDKRFQLIKRQRNLVGLSPRRFAARAAEHICEINEIHAFRDGNGRTNRSFLEILARQAGHQLHLRDIDPDLWMEGSQAGFKQDYVPMQSCIEGALGPHRE